MNSKKGILDVVADLASINNAIELKKVREQLEINQRQLLQQQLENQRFLENERISRENIEYEAQYRELKRQESEKLNQSGKKCHFIDIYKYGYDNKDHAVYFEFKSSRYGHDLNNAQKDAILKAKEWIQERLPKAEGPWIDEVNNKHWVLLIPGLLPVDEDIEGAHSAIKKYLSFFEDENFTADIEADRSTFLNSVEGRRSERVRTISKLLNKFEDTHYDIINDIRVSIVPIEGNPIECRLSVADPEELSDARLVKVMVADKINNANGIQGSVEIGRIDLHTGLTGSLFAFIVSLTAAYSLIHFDLGWRGLFAIGLTALGSLYLSYLALNNHLYFSKLSKHKDDLLKLQNGLNMSVNQEHKDGAA